MLDRDSAAKRLLWLLYLLLAAAAAILFYQVLFRPLLPLAAAFLLSGLIAGPADAMHRRTRLPTGLWALVLTVAALAVLCLGLWGCYRVFTEQAARSLAALPDILSRLRESLSALQVKYFPERSGELLPRLQPPSLDLTALADPLGRLAATLPDALLTAVFTLAATVLFAAYRAEVLAFLRRQIEPRRLDALRRLRRYLREALLGWCKAQGILAAVTFTLLLAGFFLLRVQSALLLSALVALLDALPLFGAGAALLPWALAELLLGNTGRAAGLALLFAVILAVRNCLEPHIVGRQIGLHPLVSLIGFYLGWQFAGLAGMLLAPILLLILVKLREWGYSRLWR
ncbi:MAG: AI-2E family transporter [Clostridia bacterium]|nr:AI-2E family transporter [Clostridia bacterium]